MPELNTKSAYVALSNMDDYARMADIDPIGPRRVLEQFIIDAENAITAAYEQGKGFIEVAESVNTQAIEAVEFLEHQLATVTAQRDLLKDALEKLFSWVDAYAETSDTEFPAVERLCVEALASLKGE